MTKLRPFSLTLSALYFFLRRFAGLLLHPRLTLITLIQTPLTRPLIFAPTLVFAFLLLLWRLLLRPLTLLFLAPSCPLMVVKTSVLFFFLYWQLALIYLFIRLLFAYNRS